MGIMIVLRGALAAVWLSYKWQFWLAESWLHGEEILWDVHSMYKKVEKLCCYKVVESAELSLKQRHHMENLVYTFYIEVTLSYSARSLLHRGASLQRFSYLVGGLVAFKSHIFLILCWTFRPLVRDGSSWCLTRVYCMIWLFPFICSCLPQGSSNFFLPSPDQSLCDNARA